VGQAPAKTQQTIELRPSGGIVDLPAPRGGDIERAEHLARFTMRDLVGVSFVAAVFALALGKVVDGVARCIAQLFGDLSVVDLDLFDDSPQLANDFQRNFVRY
jgi:hypothetical protein